MDLSLESVLARSAIDIAECPQAEWREGAFAETIRPMRTASLQSKQLPTIVG